MIINLKSKCASKEQKWHLNMLWNRMDFSGTIFVATFGNFPEISEFLSTSVIDYRSSRDVV